MYEIETLTSSATLLEVREKGFSVSHSQEQSPVLSPGRLDPHPVVSTVLARGVPGTCELAPPHALREAGGNSQRDQGPRAKCQNASCPSLCPVLFSLTEAFRFITSEFENMFNS